MERAGRKELVRCPACGEYYKEPVDEYTGCTCANERESTVFVDEYEAMLDPYYID